MRRQCHIRGRLPDYDTFFDDPPKPPTPPPSHPVSPVPDLSRPGSQHSWGHARQPALPGAPPPSPHVFSCTSTPMGKARIAVVAAAQLDWRKKRLPDFETFFSEPPRPPPLPPSRPISPAPSFSRPSTTATIGSERLQRLNAPPPTPLQHGPMQAFDQLESEWGWRFTGARRKGIVQCARCGPDRPPGIATSPKGGRNGVGRGGGSRHDPFYYADDLHDKPWAAIVETPQRESMLLNFGPFLGGSNGRGIPEPEAASHQHGRRPFERKEAVIVSCNASHPIRRLSEEKHAAIVRCDESHLDQRPFERRQRVVAADGLRMPVTEAKHHRHSSAYVPAVSARR